MCFTVGGCDSWEWGWGPGEAGEGQSDEWDECVLQLEGATVESEAGDLERLEKDSLMSGMSSVLPPDGMTEEQAVQVYNNYNFSHKYDPGMSITKYQEEVCVLLTDSFDSYTDTICSQGWGRLQKPDYDYDYVYSAHKIIDYDYDYDYSCDWKGDYDYDYNHPITITVTCLPWKRF